jgi:nucleoside-diphosphate-sugar epimerase
LNPILITGASGFVGRAVCNRALSFGLKVKGCHRSPESAKLLPAGVGRIQIDSLDGNTDWSNALAGVEVVIHLAGRAHIMEAAPKESLEAYRKVNVEGTQRLATMAISAGVKRFVFVSTVKVNGERSASRPFRETDTAQPEDAYAISKWEAEQLLGGLAAGSQMEVVILRPPLVYGRDVRANFLRMLHLVQRRIPLPIASVSNRRSLIYVENLADAILHSVSHTKAKGQTFLVADGEGISTPELIQCIADHMNLSAPLFACPTPILTLLGRLAGKSGEVNRLIDSLAVDSSKFRTETSWIPPYSLSQGIRETVNWFFSSQQARKKTKQEVRDFVRQ